MERKNNTLRRFEVYYDLDKLKSGEICHALKRQYVDSWCKGDKIIIFYKRDLIIGLSKVSCVEYVSLAEIEEKKLYTFLGMDKKGWEEHKKKFGSHIEYEKFMFLGWEPIRVIKKELGDKDE